MKSTYALLALLCVSATHSQCAPGVPSAGNPGCIPQDRPESPYFHGNPDQLNSGAPEPRPIWSDRWGAVAIDKNTGEAGASVGQPGKSEATSSALRNCAERGGLHCEIAISYHNQCAAIALASSWLVTAHAATQIEAKSMALQECSQKRKDCVIAYSACSFPERIR